ncbi:MAG: dihydrolipoyl dehydrogenase [Pseudoflavonifractor sp.]|nr:dihydrolipoyl dehydrogenase [Pseudoflavonifractor sp.]
MTRFDLIIIGAGPGGYETAAEAARSGLSVAVIERGELGGTCLNRGCIPTKALARCAAVVNDIVSADKYGIAVAGYTPSFSRAIDRKNQIVTALRDGIATLLSGVTLINGEASFKDAQTVMVGDVEYTAPHIIVATGSAPSSLPIPGAEYAITSDFLLSMTELPDDIVIIGGGVIGLEFASILNAYGVGVTVLEYCKEILPTFDRDISRRLKQLMSRRGIRFITSAAATAITSDLTVSYESKGSTGIVKAGAVLMAVGRRPVIPRGLTECGVGITRRGITVDDSMHTGVSGIYAIGDVNGRCQLAHAASAQGEIALTHILGQQSTINMEIIPSAVYTMPECAMVGLTEERSKELGIGYTAVKTMLRSNGRAMTLGETDGLIKLICSSDDRRIMGCHILAPEADLLVQEVAIAMSAGVNADRLADTVHAHPTLAEAVRDAARATRR